MRLVFTLLEASEGGRTSSEQHDAVSATNLRLTRGTLRVATDGGQKP